MMTRLNTQQKYLSVHSDFGLLSFVLFEGIYTFRLIYTRHLGTNMTHTSSESNTAHSKGVNVSHQPAQLKLVVQMGASEGAETSFDLKLTAFCLLSVRLSPQMAGLQVGRKIHTINEDLLFLRPFSEVETMISQAFCMRRSLRLLVATKAKE